ncbi:MAG: hypothetical protein K6U79_10365, partial [Firmicutes bacterium]|nr:hypothetical protein [Bacillota bacterium]
GAGFASGQEVATFFTLRPAPGAALAAAALTLALGGGLLVRQAARAGAGTLEELLAWRSRRLARGVGPLWLGFLGLVLAAMLAGSAALLVQRGLPGRGGSALFALLVALTVVRGVEWVDRLYRWLVPAKVGALALLALLAWLGTPPTEALSPPPPAPPLQAAGSTLLGAAFGGYNLLLSAGLLLPGRRPRGAGETWAAAAGGLLAAAMAALVDAALRRTGAATLAYDVPMERLAALHGAWASALYSLVLLAAIYTTAVAVALPLAGRAAGLAGGRAGAAAGTAAVVAAAWLVAQVGFVALVRVAYPLMGLLALALLAALLAGGGRRC